MILKENQSGFRQSYSTLDNIFSIFTLFQILKSKQKKLYCAFIHFEKAFDRVWRDGLFHKLLLNNINGKMYNVIFNMYTISHITITLQDTLSVKLELDKGKTCSLFFFQCFLGDRPFNLKRGGGGGYGFLFRSEIFFSDNTS